MAGDIIDDGEDDRARAQALIAWLSDKSPDVWFEVTGHLNWDNAMPVLDWIASQPQCDRANAAAIFWGCDPLYYLRADVAHSGSPSQDLQLLQRVLGNWKSGFYRRSELAWSGDWRGAYRLARAGRPAHKDPFEIPRDLLGPIAGRAPDVPAELKAATNSELRRLLWDLGTDVAAGPPPEESQKRASWARRVRRVLGRR